MPVSGRVSSGASAVSASAANSGSSDSGSDRGSRFDSPDSSHEASARVASLLLGQAALKAPLDMACRPGATRILEAVGRLLANARRTPSKASRLNGPNSSGRSSITAANAGAARSEEHTSELQSRENLVCRLLLEKKRTQRKRQQAEH